LAVSTTAAETKPLTLKVFNVAGDAVGAAEIDPQELGGEINKQLLHETVLMYLANQRAGTHSTLRRGEVAGSTKKIFRQKGTGRARAGTKRTNKRRGGGTAKGPKPRDYEYHLPKKAVRAALKMALLSRFQDNEAVVLEELKLPEIKTRFIAEIWDNLEITGKSCLLGIGKADVDDKKTIYKSARNIKGMEVQPASQFNAYGVLRPKKLVLTKTALQELCPNVKWKNLSETSNPTEGPGAK